MKHDENIFIGFYETTFIFKAEGRLTQKSLRNINAALEKCMTDTTVTDLLIDITQCCYMDSTILGILARWAIAFRQNHDAFPFLIGLKGTALESIFRRMNLTTLFHISTTREHLEENRLSRLVFAQAYSQQEYAEHLLSAHETLAELSLENAQEFAAVIQCLRAELKDGEDLTQS